MGDLKIVTTRLDVCSEIMDDRGRLFDDKIGLLLSFHRPDATK